EPPVPDAVADHDHAPALAVDVLVLGEVAPELRLEAERRHQPGRDVRRLQALRLVADRDLAGDLPEAADRLERLELVAEVVEVEPRDVAALLALRLVR